MKKYIRKVIERILTTCARVVLWRHHPQVIVITGSAGKTTTKVTVGSVLAEGFGKNQVLISFGNLGTISGVPLALLNFKVNLLDAGFLAPLYLILLVVPSILKTFWLVIWPFYFKYVVLELTADQPGDLDITSGYLKPNISIVTNVGESHLEHFKSVVGVAREKGLIVKNVRKDGLVILNGLDDNVLGMRSLTTARAEIINTESYKFAGRAAEIVGKHYGQSIKSIQRGLGKVKSPKSRFDILKGIKGTTLVDSTYNSNPVSVRSSLERFKEIARGHRRKIIVFGDMLELGPDAEKYHQQIGQEIKKNTDYLITFGPLASTVPANFNAKTISEAYQHLINYIQPNDVILVKGSHGMRLYALIEKLKG